MYLISMEQDMLDKIHYIEQKNDVLCNMLDAEHIEVALPTVTVMKIVEGKLKIRDIIIADSRKFVPGKFTSGIQILGYRGEHKDMNNITEAELEHMMQQDADINQDVDEELPSIAEWMKR